MQRIHALVVGFLLAFLSLTAWAQTPSPQTSQGLAWLQSQQQASGAYAGAADIALPAQSTGEALAALHALGQAKDSAQTQALNYLNTATDDSTETLARRIIANTQQGLPVAALVATLKAHQNADGGFGAAPGFGSFALDTAWAIKALAAARQLASSQAQEALSWLLWQQNADGHWDGLDGGFDLAATAQVTEALWLTRTVYGVNAALFNAHQWLMAQQASGQWGSTLDNAQALRAVLLSLPDTSSVQTALTALTSAQNANGSWSGDVYLTALALGALQLAQSPAPNPDLASLSASVLDAQTRVPLDGIALNLIGPLPSVAQQTTHTTATGAFQFAALTAGDYQLEIPSQGEYHRTLLAITLGAGQNLNAGDLLLNRNANPSTAILLGKVTRADTGAALAGATVKAGLLEATTGSDGNYQIMGLLPGVLTIEATFAGMRTAIGEATAVAGQTLLFSPALVPIGGNPDGAISGTVIDKITQQPLPGVTISIANAFTATAVTDADGAFSITPIPAAGKIVIAASKSGYQSVNGNVTVALDSRIDFSPQLVPVGSTADKGKLYGFVHDAETDAPIADAAVIVQLSNTSTASVTTAADGGYVLDDVPTGTTRIVISKAGYAQASAEGTMVAGGLMEFSPKLHTQTPGLTTSAVFGTVTKGSDGTAVAGATVYLSGVQSHSATTAADGAYRVDNLPAGNYSISISHADFESANANFDLPALTEMQFSPQLSNSTGNPVIVPNSATLSGRLLDSTTLRPIDNASYAVEGSPFERGVNRFGRFNVIGVTTQAANVTFSAPGYHTLNAQFSITPLMQQDVGDIYLERIVAARLPDLAVAKFDISGITTDPDTLAVSGSVEVEVTNQGAQDTPHDIDVLVFEDIDRDGRYTPGLDQVVGSASISGGFVMGQTKTAHITASGTLRYRDAPLRLFIDSANAVVELDEDNNIDLYGTGPGYAAQTYADKPGFDLGRKINVAVDSSGAALQLAENVRAFDNIWIANSGRGTVLKVDITTGKVLGEYRSAPEGMGTNPSRTTVDKNGNVWVTNRDESGYVAKDAIAPGLPASDRYMGSVIKIGLAENGQCVDKNGNGIIETSTGLGDVKDWKNTASADDLGGTSTSEDECILEYVRVNSSGARHLSVNRHNQVWVSGTGGTNFDLLSEDGDIIRQENSVGYGGYGGLIDANDVIWSATAGPILRWDTHNPLTGPAGGNWQIIDSAYGLCIDSKGNVWSSHGYVFRPDGTTLFRFGGGFQGCAIDNNDHAWVANSYYVEHYNSQGVHIGTIHTSATGGTTGLSTDANGNVWAVGGWTYVRIDPTAGAIGADGVSPIGAIDITGPDLGPGSYLYNYSDMTGSTLSGKPKVGTWTVVHDSGTPGSLWGMINWHAQVLGDGSLSVSAATSDDCTNYSAEVIASSGHALAGLPPGQCIRISVHFKRASTDESPVLYDLTVRPAVPDLTAAQVRAVDQGFGSLPDVQALIGNASPFDADAPFDISFWKGNPATGGVLLGTVALPSLAADHSQRVTLAGVDVSYGDQIFVQADSSDVYAEYNKTNNWADNALKASNQHAALSVATDQPSYPAGSPVDLSALARNLGSFPADYRLQLTVKNSLDEPVIQFSPVALGTLAGNASVAHQQPWNTGSTRAGAYVLYGELSNSAGEPIAQANAPFAIITGDPADPQGWLRVLTDKAEYFPSDRISIDTLARNLTANLTIAGASVALSVRDPLNSEVFNQTLSLGDLNPNALRASNALQTLAAATLGNYTVAATLYDESNLEYARASTGYSVVAPPAQPNPDLGGSVSINHAQIQIGDAQHRHDTVRNLGAAIPSLKVARVLVEDRSGSVLARVDNTIALAAGGSHSWPQIPVPTHALAEGDYTVALVAEDASGWRALSVASFKVQGRAPGGGSGGTRAQPIPANQPWAIALLALLLAAAAGVQRAQQAKRNHKAG